MIWYRALDFLKTRNGQMVLFAVALAGLFLVAARVHKARQLKKQEEESHLPRLSQNEFWEGKEAGDHFGKKSEFEVGEVKPVTQLFRLPPKKEQPPQPVRVQEPPKNVEEAFVPPLPMIAFQRSVSPAVVPEESDEESLASEPDIEIEPGQLLYCQLLAPVSSKQGSAPVLGQLTRAYVVQGRVILPAGTTVTGQLQGTSGERFSFGNEWVATLSRGERVQFSGQVQEAAFDETARTYLPNDGLPGLPGKSKVIEEKSDRGRTLLKTITGEASRLAQDRVRTEVGEVIPVSGRNIALSGTSDLLEEILGEGDDVPETHRPQFTVNSGTSFYLFLTANGEF